MSSFQQSQHHASGEHRSPHNPSVPSISEHAMYDYSNGNIVKNQNMLSGRNPYMINMSSLSPPSPGSRAPEGGEGSMINSSSNVASAVTEHGNISHDGGDMLQRPSRFDAGMTPEHTVKPQQGSTSSSMISLDPSAQPNDNVNSNAAWGGMPHQGQGHNQDLRNGPNGYPLNWNYYPPTYPSPSLSNSNSIQSSSTGGNTYLPVQPPTPTPQGWQGYQYQCPPQFYIGADGKAYPSHMVPGGPAPQTHPHQMSTSFIPYNMPPYGVIPPQQFYNQNSSSQGHNNFHNASPSLSTANMDRVLNPIKRDFPSHEQDASLKKARTTDWASHMTSFESRESLPPAQSPVPMTQSPVPMMQSPAPMIQSSAMVVPQGPPPQVAPIEPVKPREYDPEGFTRAITQLLQSKKPAAYIADEYSRMMKEIDKNTWTKNSKEEFDIGLQYALKYGSTGFWTEMGENLSFVARMRNWMVAMLRSKKGDRLVSAVHVLEKIPVSWDDLVSSKFPQVLTILEKKGDDKIQLLAKRLIANKKADKEREIKEQERQKKEKAKEKTKKNDAAASSFGFFKNLQTSKPEKKSTTPAAGKTAPSSNSASKTEGGRLKDPTIVDVSSPPTSSAANEIPTAVKPTAPAKSTQSAAPLLFSGKMSLKNQLERKEEARQSLDKTAASASEEENKTKSSVDTNGRRSKKKKTVTWRDDNLVEVREFEVEYDTGLKSAFDAKRLDIDEAHHALHIPQGDNTLATNDDVEEAVQREWYTPIPFLIDRNIFPSSAIEQNSTKRGGRASIASKDAITQIERESQALVEVYHDPADIPATPKEPPMAANNVDSNWRPRLVRRAEEIEDHPLINQTRSQFELENDPQPSQLSSSNSNGLLNNIMASVNASQTQGASSVNTPLNDILARLAASQQTTQPADRGYGHDEHLSSGPAQYQASNQYSVQHGGSNFNNRRDNDVLARRQRDVRKAVRENTGDFDKYSWSCKFFEKGDCRRGQYCTFLHLE